MSLSFGSYVHVSRDILRIDQPMWEFILKANNSASLCSLWPPVVLHVSPHINKELFKKLVQCSLKHYFYYKNKSFKT